MVAVSCGSANASTQGPTENSDRNEVHTRGYDEVVIIVVWGESFVTTLDKSLFSVAGIGKIPWQR